MPSLTFHGGVNEIGGNKILLETKEARIFFDFGESFTLLDDYFLPEAFLEPRGRFGLRDWFEFGLIPKLEGLYSKEALTRTGVRYKEPEYDAVFLSHAHMDHWQHCRCLHPDVPIYAGECTWKLLDSTWETTRKKAAHKHLKREKFRGSRKAKVGGVEKKQLFT